MMHSDLNDRQREAVLHKDGPLLILAGAGSGKTRVLTHRIANLIGEHNVDPYNIMAITFTNKAADEMRERVDRIVGNGSERVWVATFHSSCVRILRRFIDRLGYDTNFTIYDTDDQKALIKNIFKSLGIDSQMLKEKNAMRVISSCKDELRTPEEYEKEAAEYREELISKVYTEYQKQLKKNNALDFDDLIVKTVELFEANADVLDYYQERFRYIMVDEYQDTNNAQFRFVELLARKYNNICVVGDDDQSIYKFRGANIENILSFEKAFRNTTVIKLEQNYRSTGNILEAANQVIRHNRGRKDKHLWTEKNAGEKVRLFQFPDAYAEADAVIGSIKADCTDGDYSKYAILYRTNAQSRLLEERCVTMQVPYQLIGGVNFYQRKEIKDMIAYLKTIANGRDDLAAARIINVPKRGIGAASMAKLGAFAGENGISLYDAMRISEEVPGLSKASGKISGFVELIEGYKQKLSGGMRIAEVIDSLLNDTGYRTELEEEGEIECQARVENIEELKNKASRYEDLEEFLIDVALIADVDSYEDGQSKITLMTLHSAKGLEFPAVYMTGMEEGLFPSSMSINSDDRSEIEEERRLCYVGITRAMQKLTLTFARSRMVNGETMWSRASRFVDEINDDLLDKHLLENSFRRDSFDEDDEDDSFIGKRGMKSNPEKNVFRTAVGDFRRPAFSSSAAPAFSSHTKPAFGKTVPERPDHLEYGVGDRVRHTKFGEGTVTGIKEGARDFEVTVEFDTKGTRNLLAGFAKLEKV